MKIKEILRELPTIYPVYDMGDKKVVPEENHRYLLDQVREISKVVGVKLS